MRNHLLPEKGRFYKANLHAHSVLSDGALTAANMKAAYQSRGYQVLAVTDHELLFPHNDLTDERFVMLTGYEMAFNERLNMSYEHVRTCHINLFARDPLNTVQVAFDPDMVFCGPENAKERVRFTGDQVARAYTPDSVNDAVAKARANGFIAQLNHPAWSLETAAQLMKYRGFFAMEVYNHGCAVEGVDENNAQVYDMLLRSGARLGLTATDDNHNPLPLSDPRSDSFGGFTMIKAPSLTYDNVFLALEKGDYYASTGPEINDLYVEDGYIHIACSSARSIDLTTYGRRSERAVHADRACFALNGMEGYVRLTVTDHEGRRAYTRAYFANELFEDQARCHFDGAPFRKGAAHGDA